jgi:hypothetical protein
MKGTLPLGCGQCQPCRVKSKMIWGNRIMIESMAYDTPSAFVTLTYRPEELDKVGYSVHRSEIKDWQKRFRYHAGIKCRFFSVGEYGTENDRAHYHAIIFGFPGCTSQDIKCPCYSCETLRRSWDKGFVYNGVLTKDSARYVAGYVTKKMTDRNPQEKYEKLLEKGKIKLAENYKDQVINYLQGRNPEFAIMSNKPGIGAPLLPKIKELLNSEYGREYIFLNGDVPDALDFPVGKLRLGTYLKEKLRKEFGIDEKAKKEKLRKLQKEKETEYREYLETFTFQERVKKIPLGHKEFIVEQNIQKIREIEQRQSEYFRKKREQRRTDV